MMRNRLQRIGLIGRLVVFGVLVFYSTVPAAVEEKSTKAKINLAVADFEAQNVSQVEAMAISDFLRMGLVKANLFKVVERKSMAMLLEEQKFQTTGCTEQECAVEMGRLLNVQKMIIGSLSKLGELYYISANVVEVETGQITISERVNSYKIEELVDKAEELARILTTRILGKEIKAVEPTITPKPLVQNQPCIIEVGKEGKRVTINRGFLDRVKERDIYQIHHGAKEIGKLRIDSTGSQEAIGIVTSLNQNETIEQGLPVLYVGRQKICGIGLMLGPVKSSDFNTGGCFNFYYDYVATSGWGFQLTLGGNWGEKEITVKKEYTYWGGGGTYFYYSTEYVEVGYPCPITLKYHFNYDSSVSPYLGLGIVNSYFNYPEKYEEEKLAPLFNVGVDFFAMSLAHLTFDAKYFMGGDIYGFNTNLWGLSGGVSLHW